MESKSGTVPGSLPGSHSWANFKGTKTTPGGVKLGQVGGQIGSVPDYPPPSSNEQSVSEYPQAWVSTPPKKAPLTK